MVHIKEAAAVQVVLSLIRCSCCCCCCYCCVVVSSLLPLALNALLVRTQRTGPAVLIERWHASPPVFAACNFSPHEPKTRDTQDAITETNAPSTMCPAFSATCRLLIHSQKQETNGSSVYPSAPRAHSHVANNPTTGNKATKHNQNTDPSL